MIFMNKHYDMGNGIEILMFHVSIFDREIK